MKQTFVGGDIIETTGGNNLSYAKDVIENVGSQVIQQGKGSGVSYGKQGAPPKNNKIYDVVMFVAGTTDPVNTTGLKHQANTDYWQASKDNFWAKIKELKPQFLNLHIEGSFFSWSGDNDTKERNLAATRLLDLFLRVYKFWKNQEVHIHLIGHSHGGNVINQFTELIATDAKYPKAWKVKSITYLSTPFFQHKHQLNHSKLHKKCQIINVHNEYDLTQQLIADFSLVNLEGLIKAFQMDKFDRGIKILKSVNTEAITKYLKGFPTKSKSTAAWAEMAKAFLGINMITAEFINYINSIKLDNANLTNEKNTFISLLNQFLQWTYDVHKNYTDGGSYDKITWAKNLNLTQGMKVLNILFDIKSGVKDSYILKLLAKLFRAKAGITDSIEVTSWSPAKQTKSLPILHVPIFDKDPYHSRNKRSQCKKFIAGASAAVHNNNLEEVLMRLLSQFIKPTELEKYIDYINNAEYIITGNLDKELKTLRGNFERYHTLVEQYYADLVTAKDETDIKDLIKRPGTIPYLAMASHSLSHTQFWPDVEAGLKKSFSSGKNPGYMKK
jgi:hypothetical protein